MLSLLSLPCRWLGTALTVRFVAAEKQRFNKAFEDVKTLRRAQKLRTGKQMQEAKQQAYVTGSLGAPGGGIVRSTTWSSMAPSDRGGWVK